MKSGKYTLGFKTVLRSLRSSKGTILIHPMGRERRAPASTEEVEFEIEADKEKVNDSTALKPEQEPQKKNLKPMERRKKRKQMNKEKHHSDPKSKAEVNDKPAECPPVKEAPLRSSAASSPGFHINVFRDLAAADLSVRKAAAETLAVELIAVQRAYEGRREGKERGQFSWKRRRMMGWRIARCL